MSIQVTCPACGKSMSVEDRFAGQAGPCPGCGVGITIPLPAGAAYPSSGNSSGWIIGAVIGVGMAFLLCGGLMVALLLPAIQAARTSAQRAQSMNNMKQLMLAMHNYHDQQGSLPPAYVTDSSGKPLYSWRVLILPYLERADLYERFDKEKAWDAPENIAVSSEMVYQFRSLQDETASLNGTSYICVVGPNTLFTGDKPVKFHEVTDGLSNTLALIEVAGVQGSWAEPLDARESQRRLVISRNPGDFPETYPGGTNIGIADGSVRFLKSTDSPRILPFLIDRRDGQIVPQF